MYLFSIAEKLAQDNSEITLDVKKCARSVDRFSKCEICIGACPTAAIKLDKPIAFDPKLCVSCGGCLHLCPLGAFSGEDRVVDLFNLIPRLPDASALQLTCQHHPAPGMAPQGVSATVRMNGCLASLGASAFLWLLGEGAKQIIVRLDACASCEIGKVSSEIAQTIADVRGILNVRGQMDRVVKVDTPRDDLKSVDVYDSKEPPLSRRDLFRSVAAQAPKIATQVMPMIDTRPTKGKRPPLERRRLLNTLKRLPKDGVDSSPLSLEPIRGIIRKTANEKCTACGACARVCPTGALQFTTGETDFRLTFSTGACTDCGACLDVCKPGALACSGMPSLAEFIATEPAELISGALRVCSKCGAKFAGEMTGTLCAICDFRQQNPFGSRLTEEIARMKSQKQA